MAGEGCTGSQTSRGCWQHRTWTGCRCSTKQRRWGSNGSCWSRWHWLGTSTRPVCLESRISRLLIVLMCSGSPCKWQTGLSISAHSTFPHPNIFFSCVACASAGAIVFVCCGDWLSRPDQGSGQRSRCPAPWLPFIWSSAHSGSQEKWLHFYPANSARAQAHEAIERKEKGGSTSCPHPRFSRDLRLLTGSDQADGRRARATIGVVDV